jgi:hypothetical protein
MKRDTKRDCCSMPSACGISPKALKTAYRCRHRRDAQFFEQMGVPTRLSDYGLDGSSIPALLAKLEEHGMTKLGEHQDITWTSAAVFTRLHANYRLIHLSLR